MNMSLEKRIETLERAVGRGRRRISLTRARERRGENQERSCEGERRAHEVAAPFFEGREPCPHLQHKRGADQSR